METSLERAGFDGELVLESGPLNLACSLPFCGKLGAMIVVIKGLVDGEKRERGKRRESLGQVGRRL